MDHAEVYACVKELARASGIPVKKEQLPSISLHGYYSPSENAITINSNLEDTKAAVTLCHEYAHGLLHRTSTQSEAICEFEAQSLALMLMARYGLPQDDSEIGYMKTYLERANNDKNFSLDTSLERLQKQLKFVDERISLIAEHRQTEFAQTRAQAREPGKGKQVSEIFGWGCERRIQEKGGYELNEKEKQVAGRYACDTVILWNGVDAGFDVAGAASLVCASFDSGRGRRRLFLFGEYAA